MGRHSIKFKIALLLTVIITSLLALLLILNTTQAERFYFSNKQKQMISRYEYIDGTLLDYDSGRITKDQMYDSIERQMLNTGVSVIVVNSGWSTVYANIKGEDALVERLRISMFNGDMLDSFIKPDDSYDKWQKKPETGSTESQSENTDTDGAAQQPQKKPGKPDKTDKGDAEYSFIIQEIQEGHRAVIAKTDSYTLQKSFDSRLGAEYYELWGTLGNGNFIMMRTAVQSIKDNVVISNKFIAYMGIATLVIGIIVCIIFSDYFTKPIKELSNIAKRMADLDFEARYEGKDKSEIGILGSCMNDLSERLEENISQLKAANMELQRDIAHKIQIDQMRTEFLSNVSHELKTPIALIQGYAEGLKEGISDDPESMQYYCDVIIDEASKMNMMVKKLLTLNQIEFGGEELVMERFDVVALLKGCINANELLAAQNDIAISFTHEKERMDVWSDEYKIEEVITNYLTNAINHCEFDKKIQVDAAYMENVVRVSVFNTGKHIPDEELDKIWIKFYKVDKARTREYGGNGIGLSIVKAIMDSYGKQCGAENVEGGVRFWFDLDAKA